ncbi:hypothetical protein JJ691_09490 [Kutzneria sp. CA-103260]|nr:hypothetical protein JJ691_09490 [Kutzneria sp. CA-103260]
MNSGWTKEKVMRIQIWPKRQRRKVRPPKQPPPQTLEGGFCVEGAMAYALSPAIEAGAACPVLCLDCHRPEAPRKIHPEPPGEPPLSRRRSITESTTHGNCAARAHDPTPHPPHTPYRTFPNTRLTAISTNTRFGFTRGCRYRSAYRRTASAIASGSSLSLATPSKVDHRRPSTWHTAACTFPADRSCRALAESPSVMTRAMPSTTSRVTPTGTTCGVPSGRTVVRVHRCRSRQNSAKSAPLVLSSDTPSGYQRRRARQDGRRQVDVRSNLRESRPPSHRMHETDSYIRCA